MQFKIGTTDFTSAVQESTYKIDRVKKSVAWKNANNVEKHSNVYYKVEGSFEMVFLPGYSVEYSAFLQALADNTTNDVTVVTLSVNNMDGAITTINCFIDITFLPMKDPKNGSNILVKRCTCKLKEC